MLNCENVSLVGSNRLNRGPIMTFQLTTIFFSIHFQPVSKSSKNFSHPLRQTSPPTPEKTQRSIYLLCHQLAYTVLFVISADFKWHDSGLYQPCRRLNSHYAVLSFHSKGLHYLKTTTWDATQGFFCLWACSQAVLVQEPLQRSLLKNREQPRVYSALVECAAAVWALTPFS